MNTPLKPFIIPVFIPHSGCPHQCIFCNQKAITGTSDIPSPDDIENTVDDFLKYKQKKHSFVEVSFYGGNFLGLSQKKIQALLDIATTYVKSGKIDGVRFSTRPDTISKDSLRLIKQYPVSTIELGVQSMNDDVLEKSFRGHDSKNAVYAVNLLKQKNYQIGLQMMTGLPGDDDKKALDSALKIALLKPSFVRIYPTLVIKGSRLLDLYKKNQYTPQSIEESVSLLKKLYLLFQQHHITVIRMGLQASDSLNDSSTVIAGPYHPALGHMVFSKIFLDQAIEQLNGKNVQNEPVILVVHPRSISRMQGLNKKNIHVLKQMFNIRSLRLQTDPLLSFDEVRVESL